MPTERMLTRISGQVFSLLCISRYSTIKASSFLDLAFDNTDLQTITFIYILSLCISLNKNHTNDLLLNL